MKKTSVFYTVILSFFFLTGMAPVSYSPEVNASYEQLKSELQKKGVDVGQINDSAVPLKDLLANGVKKDEVKRLAFDMANKKLDKESFKSSIVSVSDLVKNGEQYKKARNLVTSSIDKARAQGLKGKELSKSVRDAIKERMAQLDVLKKEGLAKMQEVKGGLDKASKDARATSFKYPFKADSQVSGENAAWQPSVHEAAKKYPQAKLEPAVSVKQPGSDVAKDIDNAVMPVLKKLFGDTRIIAESKSPETKADGEVMENRIIYKVKKALTVADGYALHSELRSTGFASSPRLGSKPSEWRGNVAMSLFRTTSLRAYSLVINVDTVKQQITVESYKTGSKYDRLM
jgi:hypothetical protein